MPIATLLDGTTLEYEENELASGAMKIVHYTSDRQNVVCFYINQEDKDSRLERLKAILGKYNPTTDKLAKYYKQRFCWLTAIVTEPKLGIVTPLYPQNYFFSSETRKKGKEKSLSNFIYPNTRRLLTKEDIGFFNKHIEICIHLVRAVKKLHFSGLAHSDLSDKNVLIDPPTGKSLIIDIDSLVVDSIFPADVLGTEGYMAPEIIKDPINCKPSTQTDLHSLGVIIYQILLGRHPLKGPKIHEALSGEEQDRLEFGVSPLYIEHPTDSSNRPSDFNFTAEKILGTSLSELFRKVFVDGLHNPTKRPLATAWERELLKINEKLICCTNENCSHKWFVYRSFEKTQICPFCNSPLQDTAIVELIVDNNKDKKRLVIYDNRPLFKYHFQGTDAFLEEDETQLANFKLIDNKWYLVINTDLISLSSSQTEQLQTYGTQPQIIFLEDSIKLIFQQDYSKEIKITIPNPNAKIELKNESDPSETPEVESKNETPAYNNKKNLPGRLEEIKKIVPQSYIKELQLFILLTILVTVLCRVILPCIE